MSASSSSSPCSSTSSYWTSVWMDFAAGWCSGAMAVICCQPVDTLLTKYQVATPNALRSSTPWVLARQYLWTQPKVLWRGSTCMASAVPFQNALLLTGYGWGKQVWSDADGTSSDGYSAVDIDHSYNKKIMGIFIGGLGGGMLQSFVTSPVEWIKVQQQLSGAATTTTAAITTITTTTTTTSSTSTSVLLRHLAGNPWRGLHATLWRDGIPHGVWFCSYEMCKDAMMTTDNHEYRYGKVTTSLVSGAVAATVAWAVGYPFDLIKTRIQAVHRASTASSSATLEPPMLGIWATARQIMYEGSSTATLISSSSTKTAGGATAAAAEVVVPIMVPNVLALYRGFGWKLVRAIPASMIGFTTYEFVLAQLQMMTAHDLSQ